jgi:hypothetical protein
VLAALPAARCTYVPPCARCCRTQLVVLASVLYSHQERGSAERCDLSTRPSLCKPSYRRHKVNSDGRTMTPNEMLTVYQRHRAAEEAPRLPGSNADSHAGLLLGARVAGPTQ